MGTTETLGTEEPQDMTGEDGSQHTHTHRALGYKF